MSTTTVAYHARGVTFTDRGAEKVRELLPEDAGAVIAGLRIEVQNGGCGGFQYRLAFDRAKQGDAVFEDHGLRVLIDNRTLMYVDGSSIDWIDALAGLQINNPNVVSSCGCGSSFQIAAATQDATI